MPQAISLISARFSDTEVMLASNKTQWASECLQAISQMEHAEEILTNDCANSDFWPSSDSYMSYYRPYKVTDGTLTINVKGMLIHNFGYQLGDYATGYEYIRQALIRGLGDTEVKRIAMICASGGGHVAGNFDLVDFIYNSRGVKPIEAFVNESAYSACMSIASACDKITMTRTSGVGSIGVVTMHVDYTKYLENSGIKITLLAVGEYKTEGSQYSILTEAAKKRTIDRLTGVYDIFTATVARNLNISEDVVRGTEAQTYSAPEAVELGLAHAISSFNEAITGFASGETVTDEDDSMSDQEKADIAAKEKADAANAARAEGTTQGATAERTRISAIMNCEEAKGRSTLANHLAMNTGTSPEDAKAILGASALEVVATTVVDPKKTVIKKNHFEEAMNNSENPEITASDEDSSGELSTDDQVKTIMGNYTAHSGFKSARKH